MKYFNHLEKCARMLKNLESEQLALLEEKKVKAEKVRVTRIANGGRDPSMEEDNI